MADVVVYHPDEVALVDEAIEDKVAQLEELCVANFSPVPHLAESFKRIAEQFDKYLPAHVDYGWGTDPAVLSRPIEDTMPTNPRAWSTRGQRDNLRNAGCHKVKGLVRQVIMPVRRVRV